MNKFKTFIRLESIILELRTRQSWPWSQRSQFISRSLRSSAPLNEHNNTSYRQSQQIGKWSRLLEKRPCLTTALSTGTIMGVGDLIAQLVLESKVFAALDVLRLVRYVGIGVFLAGPGMCCWYSALDKHIVNGTKVSKMARKLLLDQVVFLPFYLFIYLIVLAVSRGDKPEEIKRKLGRDMHPNLIDSYKLWPLIQAVNFYLLPLKFRVIFINFIALFWNAYIGWKAER